MNPLFACDDCTLSSGRRCAFFLKAGERVRQALKRAIIREPSGLRAHHGPGSTGTPSLKVRVGLHRPLWQLGSAAHHCDGLARYHELSQVNGYPFHPSGQDMISAAPVRRASSKAPNTPNLETTQRFAASPCATMNFSAFHTTQKSRMGPGNWRFV